jgi:hypothetical protein
MAESVVPQNPLAPFQQAMPCPPLTAARPAVRPTIRHATHVAPAAGMTPPRARASARPRWSRGPSGGAGARTPSAPRPRAGQRPRLGSAKVHRAAQRSARSAVALRRVARAGITSGRTRPLSTAGAHPGPSRGPSHAQRKSRRTRHVARSAAPARSGSARSAAPASKSCTASIRSRAPWRSGGASSSGSGCGRDGCPRRWRPCMRR